MKLYKRYLQNQLYIEVEVEDETTVYQEKYMDIEVKNPRLIGVFFAEIIFQLSLRTKKEQIKLKKSICSLFDISEDTLKHALWRYYKKQYGKMEFNKTENPIVFEFIHDIGTMDDSTHWTQDIKKLSDSMITVPPKFRMEKYERALVYIGAKYGRDSKYTDYYKYCTTNIMKKVAVTL